ncbi:WXG100 family type VII secretion target [Plantactinospora sp. WMMB782]|uniref:WXG100 family type VII secretion target n=1 Tax=Plantactinospora sp. WMMB782 TaxID=3404121 RepID=UPI003B94A43E
MADEYHERYRQQSHEELYRLLMAGVPAQVDGIADTWHTVESRIGAIATGLHEDLARVLPGWTGPGSREFQYRLGLIISFAGRLAEEAAAMRGGLTVMSGSLAEAQRQAEADRPELAQARYDEFSPVLGHTLSEEERAKARERVAAQVARLAADYAVTDHRSWPATIPLEPGDLPVLGGIVDDLHLPAAVTVPEPPPLPGEAPTVGTALAGAGAFGEAPGGAALAAVPPAASAAGQPGSALSGAGPALAGVGNHLITRAGGAEGRPGPGAGTAGAGAAGAVPMTGAAGAAGLTGRPADGYPVTDPRLAGEPTAWSGDGGPQWSDEMDAPPPVLGQGD